MNPFANLPTRASPGAAGYDLYACIRSPITLYPGDSVVVPTGIAMAIEDGWHGIIRSRSGLAIRNGVFVLTGTIDSDYRGEVAVILGMIPDAEGPLVISDGDRIAQIVFLQAAACTVEDVKELDETSRGNQGFGSTGK